MANLATINNNLLADSGIDPLDLIVGTGTVNYVPKFSAEDTIANSQIFDNGSFIGFGTSSFVQSNEYIAINSSSSNTALLIKQTWGAASWPLKLWNSVSTGDPLLLEFLTNTSITPVGAVSYNRTLDRLTINGNGSGLYFTGSSSRFQNYVGIGRTPTAPVDVFVSAGDADTSGGGIAFLRYESGGDYRGSSVFHRFVTGGGGDAMLFSVSTSTNPYISGTTALNSNVKMLLNANGRLLINSFVDDGTNSLQVSGSGKFTANLIADRMAIAGIIDANARLVIGEDSSSSNVGFIRLRGHDVYEGNIYKTATYGIYMDTDSNLRPIRIDGSALIIGVTGNVLVGTTIDAGYKADISGTLRVNGSNNTAIALTVNGADASQGLIAKFARGNSEKNFYISATDNQYVNLASEGDFKIKTGVSVNQPYTSGTTTMTITSTGIVNVGSSSGPSIMNVFGGDINVDYNTASTKYVYRSFASSHVVGNRGAKMRFGLNDGSFAGISVENVASSSAGYNSQYIDFYTHEGNVDAGIVMRLGVLGAVRFNKYGVGTFTGTPTYRLAVDASGNVIEVTDGGGTVTGSGTATRVAFWDGSSSISSNANLYWDNSNGRLAIGKSSSNATLEVYAGTKGQIRANGGTAMGGGVDIYTELSGTGRRNWGIQTEVTTAGDFSILKSASAGTAPTQEVFTIQNTGVGSYKYALSVVGDLQTLGKLGATDDLGVFYRSNNDVTWKTYYKTTGTIGLYTEINGAYYIQAYNSGTPVTRFTFTAAGGFTAAATITGQDYVSNAIDNGIGEYYFFRGNAAVSNNLTMYAYSDIVYVNAYKGYHIRSNNTGGTGGYINLHGSSIMLGTADAPVLHSGTRGVVIKGSARGILELWDATTGKSVFQNVSGDTYIGQLDKGTGNGHTYLLVNGNGSSADVALTLFSDKAATFAYSVKTDGNVGIRTAASTASDTYLKTGDAGVAYQNTYFGTGSVRIGGGSDHVANTVLSVAPGVIVFDRPGVVGGAFKVHSDGKIGINQTSNAGYQLDIGGTLRVNDLTYIQKSIAGTGLGDGILFTMKNTSTTNNTRSCISFGNIDGIGSALAMQAAILKNSTTGEYDMTWDLYGGAAGWQENLLYLDSNPGTVAIGTGGSLITSTYAGRLSVHKTGSGANIALGTGSNTTNTVMSRFVTYNSNNGNSGNEGVAQFYGITSIETGLTTSNSNASSNSGGYIMFKTKADAGTLEERVRITDIGRVGIGDTDPQSGLRLNKYGTKWDTDSQYNQPSGNIFLSIASSTVNADNWFGIRGNYGSSSGSANILLQANFRDVNSQAGHYIASIATALGASDFAIGKLVTQTSVSTPPTKVEQFRIAASDGTVSIRYFAEVGRSINGTQYNILSENQLHRTGGGDLYINSSGTGNVRVVEGGAALLVNTGTRWNQEKFGIQISNAGSWTNVPAMMRLTNYGSGYRTKITFTDSSIIDGWLGMNPSAASKSYFVMGFSGYTEEGFKVYQNGYAYVQNRLGVNVDYDSLGWKFQVADVGAIITGGEAISTSNMKGVMIENTNNGDESIGVWFRTGSNHLSGISAQRNNSASTWGTDLRFYTHQNATSSLTSAFERMRVTSEGELWVGYTSDQGAYMLQVNGSTYSSSGFFESSDIRLKTILNRHQSLDFDAIEYRWNDGRDSKLHWGYAAQDVMKFLPDAVNGTEELFYTLDYNQVHTYKIAMLEKRIAELESQLKNK